MKVLVLATGSVSVKLLPKLFGMLLARGHSIRYMLSQKAQIFGNSAFNVSSELAAFNCNGNKIEDYTKYTDFLTECQRYDSDEYVVHIDNATWADVIMVVPATANTIAKMNYGICDNVIMDTLLAASGMGKRIIVAPAMNTHMWRSWQTERNFVSLKGRGVEFVFPTVKKLACGDYGIGGLADIQAIADRLTGKKWKFPLDTTLNNRFIPTWPHAGAFGAVRTHEIHNGVDIYCEKEVDVFAVEDGEVVEKGKFTGADQGSPWWNDTWYLTLKGASGFVVYGEIHPSPWDVGTKFKKGDKIAKITPVLKPEKVRKDIKGHSQFMLHIELKRKLVHDGGWPLNTERPKELLDPTPYLI